MSGEKKMNLLSKKIYDLIVKVSADMPEDVELALRRAAESEKNAGNTLAYEQLSLMLENIQLARSSALPLCQDTGLINFFIDAPADFDKNEFISIKPEDIKCLFIKPGEVSTFEFNNIDALQTPFELKIDREATIKIIQGDTKSLNNIGSESSINGKNTIL